LIADALGQPPVGWADSYDTFGASNAFTKEEAATKGVWIAVEDYDLDGDPVRAVHFHDAASDVGSIIDTDIGQASMIVVDYFMMSTVADSEGAFVSLRGDVGTDYSIAFRPGGSIGIHGWMGGWIVPALMSYEANTWYHVTRYLDLYSNTGTFKVEEASNPSNGATYSIGSNYPNAFASSIFILSSTSQMADAYIKDLRVYCIR
jgi:hypothetical protein